MKKYLGFAAICAVLMAVGYVGAEQGDFSTFGFNSSGGYSYWRVDSSGHFKPGYASTYDLGTSALPVRNMYVGAITATGALSVAGVTSTSYTGVASKTLAQLALITPSAVGQLYFCSDCCGSAITGPLSRIVYSTGTALNAFSIFTDTDTYPT